MDIIKITTSLLLTFATLCLSAQVYTPSEMPNVNVANRYEFVSDPAGLLDPSVKRVVNQRLWNLRQQTSVEAVVAIPPSIGDENIAEWSEQLFTSWGIGKKDKDNGLLLVISPESRVARIQTGYGVEGALPDLACKNIINSTIVPNMREGNLTAAVDDATSLIFDALTDPDVSDELKSAQPDNYSGAVNALSSDVIWEFVGIVAGCIFLFSLGLFVYDLFSTRKLDNYHKALRWKSHIKTFIWTSVLSLGSGLVFLLFAYLIYRSARTRRRRCTTCGAKMNRLPEDKDNELLSDSQDFEERLNTVDYDVWECPKCGTVERYPYRVNQLKYTECPNCHTVAMCLCSDRTLVPATTAHVGRGEKIYECQYCHHQKHAPYEIPKKESAAPLVAGAVLGSMAGRGGNGGGFGGGFGGGSTGGGGASGGW